MVIVKIVLVATVAMVSALVVEVRTAMTVVEVGGDSDNGGDQRGRAKTRKGKKKKREGREKMLLLLVREGKLSLNAHP